MKYHVTKIDRYSSQGDVEGHHEEETLYNVELTGEDPSSFVRLSGQTADDVAMYQAHKEYEVTVSEAGTEAEVKAETEEEADASVSPSVPPSFKRPTAADTINPGPIPDALEKEPPYGTTANPASEPSVQSVP